MGQAGDDDMGIVFRRHMGVERAATQDVMAGECDQHGVLDIVIERVAVADAFDGNARDRGHHFDEMGLRGAEPASHVIGQELAQRIGRQLRNGNHDHCPRTPRLSVCGARPAEPKP